jgi:hypothetical protein
LVTASRRARKKHHRKTGEKALAAKALRAEQHSARIASSTVEDEDVDDFLGAPLTKEETREIVAEVLVTGEPVKWPRESESTDDKDNAP